MHDFGVDFQFWPFHHIYRGVGKSEIPNVFCPVPYRHGSEIGAIDPDFDQRKSDFLGMCHPRGVKNDDFS